MRNRSSRFREAQQSISATLLMAQVVSAGPRWGRPGTRWAHPNEEDKTAETVAAFVSFSKAATYSCPPPTPTIGPLDPGLAAHLVLLAHHVFGLGWQSVRICAQVCSKVVESRAPEKRAIFGRAFVLRLPVDVSLRATAANPLYSSTFFSLRLSTQYLLCLNIERKGAHSRNCSLPSKG